MRLCFADQAAIFRLKDDIVHLAVNYGFPTEYKAYWDELGPVPLVSVREQIEFFELVSSRLLKSGDPLLNPLNCVTTFLPLHGTGGTRCGPRSIVVAMTEAGCATRPT